MENTEAEKLLTEAGVRPTANRLILVRTLSAATRPLSLTDMEDILPTLDKSSIFRTLTAFREAHLVHVLEDGGDGVRYELCLSHHADDEDDDDLHVHFYCERCHKTFCLPDIPIPDVPLPEGYRRRSVNYMIKGLCPKCK